MTSYSRYSAFEALTRKHGVVCVPPDDVSVEDLVIATGHVVGTDKVRAASRMNKCVVIFVSETELVHEIVSTGLSTDDGHFVLVSPLDTPAAVKVIIEEELFCQVEYFIDNDNGILSATKKENRQY